MIWMPESAYLKLAWVFLCYAGACSTDNTEHAAKQVGRSHTMVCGLSLCYFCRLALCGQR